MHPSFRIAHPWFLVAVISLLLAPSAHALSVNGFVSDQGSGESIAYARVSITAEGVADAVPVGALSNAGGYYAISGLTPGAYTLVCQAFGYTTLRESLTLREAETLRRDLVLEPEPFAMEGVEVRATTEKKKEAEIQTGFAELSAKRLQRVPGAVEQDIIRSLQLLPGIQAASDVSSGLYIRGGGPDQTLILLDQIPLYNPTHAFGFLSTFNPDAIKDVTLYKGAYPSQYGGRLGSVLDVSNRDGNRNQFHGQGGMSVIAGKMTLEGPVRNGSWIASARRTYLDPMLDAVRTEENEIPDYYFYDLNARVNQSYGTSDNVILSGYRGRDDLYLALDEGSFVDINWGNMAGTAKWTHLFAPGVFGNFLVAASEYESITEVSFFETPITFSNRLLDVSAKADIDWRLGRDHELSAGLLGSHYDFSFKSRFNGVDQPGLDERPNALSAYVQDQWAFDPVTTLRPGLRVELFGSGGVSVEPRLSFSRLVSDKVRIKAGGGRYTQHLQLVTTEGFSGGDLWVPTDDSAEPGNSWQAVAGAEWEPSLKHSLSIETYYTRMRNLVQIDGTTSADAAGRTTEDLFFTGGKGWASGVELFAQQRTGPVTGWIGYTLGFSRRKWDEVNRGKVFPPKYDRRHDVKVVLDYKREKWSYGLNFILATGQAFTPAGARYTVTNPGSGELPDDGLILPAEKNSARLLPFHRMDVSVTRHGSLFGAKAEYFLQIFNLYNRRNEWFVQYDTTDPETKPEVTYQLPVIPTVGVNFEF